MILLLQTVFRWSAVLGALAAGEVRQVFAQPVPVAAQRLVFLCGEALSCVQ
jgi:hypothetical protein